MIGVTLLQVDHKKCIHFTQASFLVPVSVPPLVGLSLALRSTLDLSWIDLIPVNNKNTQSVVYYLKKTTILYILSAAKIQEHKKKRPGPRFEPGSEDPQSSRITNYPTLANVPFTFAPDSD
jgi:hypothetical protein